jgi:type II secretory ATPase GspE/PulE/Tfp pilus assembly ATPase PilB-like protein
MSSTEAIDFTAVPLNGQQPQDVAMHIIREAAQRESSDLFLFSDESAVNIAVRTMGQVERLATVGRDQGRHLISYLKTMAGIDIAERRRPQEGRWIFEENGTRIDLRINIVPTLLAKIWPCGFSTASSACARSTTWGCRGRNTIG